MIFSTKLAENNKLAADSKFLEAGIHDNVRLVSAKNEISPNGKNFVEITFEKDGKTLTHTEWEPWIGTNEEEMQNKTTNQVTRFMRILRCFYPKEVLSFSSETYKEFADWVVKMLNNADKTKLLKVKVVYNNKGYTTLPSYVKFAFIEPMDIPMGFYEAGKNDSMIREIAGIDQFIRPIVADKETKEENPFNTVKSTIDELDGLNDNDLPF